MVIGKIMKSDSHINYVCQIYGMREVEEVPEPTDYSFGRFVRMPMRSVSSDRQYGYSPTTFAVGVIYDTILLNSTCAQIAPRLSNEAQAEVFSPDLLSERAVLVQVLLLGMVELRPCQTPEEPTAVSSVIHGIPSFAPELGCEVETLNDADVRAFHFFCERPGPDALEYLHMGYLPHIISQNNSLLPQVVLRIIDQLERLLPNQTRQLGIVKRNLAWRLKVETTG